MNRSRSNRRTRAIHFARLVAACSLCVLAAAAASAAPAAAPAAKHPLDPLTFQEYWTVLEVLHASGKVDSDTRFSIITLQEPAKDVVWRFDAAASGDTATTGAAADFPRRAFAVVRQKEKEWEAVVDLRQRAVVSFDALEGVQPNWLAEEFKSVAEEVKKNPEFIAAMKKRGIEDFTFIECGGGPPGYYGTREQKGRRIAHVACSDVRGVRNTWTRHVEGLTVVVDADTKEVLRVVDEGAVPMPSTLAEYDAASIGETREVKSPMHVDQPLGPGFDLDGNVVDWQGWRFHVRPDQRLGMVISTVTYRDGERRRPVLYQGSLSEIFVPYMDPAFTWYHRNFLDAGEYSAGGLTQPLMRGLDCPPHAVYLDGLVSGDDGRPHTSPNLICLFEREAGDMAWRHVSDDPESRVKRDLVARTAAVLGNYDYVFDWVFQQDGSIKVAVGATGISEVKMTAQPDAGPADPNDPTIGANSMPESADAYGRFVARNIVAVNHDHYFSFRLDLDVDGSNNTLVVDRLVPRELPKDSPRRSIWVREQHVARRESEGMLDMDMHHPALWRVVSDDETNHVGYPTSYQLMPGMSAMTLLSPDDYPRRRAGFIDHQLWTTPYRQEERFAAGDHPTLSEPGQGLPDWTKQDRAIQDTDVVLWHTIGMHHVVRGEDWPVMPVMWHSFELRPFDFFDGNPALDLPKR
jgi:primary-amine oxidase